MGLKQEYVWGGTSREPVVTIYENGTRVASFDTEAEADAWVQEEYGTEAWLQMEIK